MKKIILFFAFTILTLVSCSSNDDNSENKKQTNSNPPAWIIGTWSNGDTTYIFTEDDIKYTVNGVTTSMKEVMNDYYKYNTGVSIASEVKQTSNNNSYNAIYTLGDTKTTFSFTKNSNTKITSNSYLEGVYIKQ
ncbi:hypothetical protein [Flavobacterium sp. H4147]|uniref:hypothetical protein n=1 Tax=Flavobacterium sp. H4147 TaxID=3034149 RepID=UPI0023EAD31E|nr:hypothetical protein [Flavobacterium sp. H4147]